MKTIKFFTVMVLLAGMVFTSCKKEPASSTVTSLKVKMQATNKSFSIYKSASVNTPSFVWDTAYLNVSKIELEAEMMGNESSKDSSSMERENGKSKDASGTELEWKGPKKIDLFNINSFIGSFDLKPGSYDNISITVEAYKSDAGTDPVFYLSGTYKNATEVNIPIEVIVNEDLEFEIEKEGVMLNAANDYASLLNVNLNLLMNGILQSDLDNAMLTNGKIVISSTSNSALYTTIKENFSKSEESEIKHE